MRLKSAALGLLLAAACNVQASDVGFEPHPGAQLPLDITMRDEADRPLTLGAAMGASPWILTFGYFNCPNLCDTVRADLIGALKGLPPDLAYRVAAVSIDPGEAVADVNEARVRDATYQSRAGRWRYLRADAATLAVLTRAAGFKARYDAATGQIAHPAGLVFVTPQGQVSSYLLGVGYRSEAVARALADAGQGRLAAAPPAAVALLCFDYDASTGRYSFAILKLLRALGILSVLVIAGGIVLLARRPRLHA